MDIRFLAWTGNKATVESLVNMMPTTDKDKGFAVIENCTGISIYGVPLEVVQSRKYRGQEFKEMTDTEIVKLDRLLSSPAEDILIVSFSGGEGNKPAYSKNNGTWLSIDNLDKDSLAYLQRYHQLVYGNNIESAAEMIDVILSLLKTRGTDNNTAMNIAMNLLYNFGFSINFTPKEKKIDITNSWPSQLFTIKYKSPKGTVITNQMCSQVTADRVEYHQGSNVLLEKNSYSLFPKNTPIDITKRIHTWSEKLDDKKTFNRCDVCKSSLTSIRGIEVIEEIGWNSNTDLCVNCYSIIKKGSRPKCGEPNISSFFDYSTEDDFLSAIWGLDDISGKGLVLNKTKE